MFELLKAIKTAYNTADGVSGVFTILRTANTGGLYTQQHKQKPTKPYIVLHHLGGTSEYTMGSSSRTEIKDSTLQFTFNCLTLAILMDILKKFGDAFDDLSLTYDSETQIVMERVDAGELINEVDFWSTTLDYRVMRAATVTGTELIEHLYNLMSIN